MFFKSKSAMKCVDSVKIEIPTAMRSATKGALTKNIRDYQVKVAENGHPLAGATVIIGHGSMISSMFQALFLFLYDK